MHRTTASIFLVSVFLFTIGVGPSGRAQTALAKSQPVLDVTSMDTSVDPCTDFFTYSCGAWIKKNPIPPDQTSWSVYSKLEDDNKAILREILESAAMPAGERDAVKRKIGDYYAACMDEKAIDARGLAPLQPELDRIRNLTDKAQLAGEIAHLQAIGVGALFEFGSGQDFKDSNAVIAQFDQGGLGLPDRDYYLKDDAKSEELRKAYLAHVAKMFELVGDKPADAVTEAATVMRIEAALAKGQMTLVERRDPPKLYHKMSVEELQKLAPAFGWNTYFTKTGVGSLTSPLGTLNVVTPDYFHLMSEEIEKKTLADWKTYLRWHAAHDAAADLSAAFVKENFSFYGNTLRGQEELPPRWKRCTNDVDNNLGEALGQAYVAKYFSPEAKRAALKIVKEVEAAMLSEIQSLPWMGAVTKEQALTKLHAIANKIGYPDTWRDYSSLEIVRGDEIGNSERASWFEFHRWLAKIGKPVDRKEWDMTPPTVNADYDPQKNDINFPAGILQPPLFSALSDAAPNYGDTGATMGHELTHAFDDEGSQFDAQGNLRNWWTDADRKEFEQRAQCVVDQYSGYTIIDDIKINGKLTNGEDLADLGGTLLAYLAWKEDTKDQKLEPLDGLTPEQRFFVAYGQSWCTNERNENKRLRATVDPHSPEKYRANGVAANMKEFRDAFHCKPGQPMVRENACRVW